MSKAYLGDSVYAEVVRGMLRLTTENGYGATNEIYLEPEVWLALMAYVEVLKARLAHETDRGSTDDTTGAQRPAKATDCAHGAEDEAPGAGGSVATKDAPPNEPLKAGDEPARESVDCLRAIVDEAARTPIMHEEED